MCQATSLAWSALPTELTWRADLKRRVFERRGEREILFHHEDRRPCLPIWRDGQFHVVRWRNSRGQSRFLPRTSWTWLETLQQGAWRGSGAIRVKILASFGLDKGVWYPIRRGIRGILVPDELGAAVAYMLCELASHYYQIMTRSSRMPVLIEERISTLSQS